MAQSPFSFRTANEILFGRGQAKAAAGRITAFGSDVLLVHGAHAERSDWLAEDLQRQGCRLQRLAIGGEPDMATITDGVETGRAFGAGVVVALGGGAVIDAGKAIAALIPATRPMIDHLEVVGLGLPLDHPPLPYIAMPTTAGTGAEVTRNAVIGVAEHRRKVSLRDARMLPLLAIVDPALTDGTPKAITLACGLDALTQLIEPYISLKANAMTDALCRDAIPTGLSALKRLMDHEDPEARDQLCWASLCGGLALANAGLGVVHGLAGPLGGLRPVAHGTICGALLVEAIRTNRAYVVDAAIGARIDQVLSWIGQAFDAKSDDSLDVLAAWLETQGLRRLSALGFSPEDMALAATAGQDSSSMKANPVRLTQAQLIGLMQASG